MSIPPSEYYTIEKARGVLVQNSDNLSLLSLNVRSLQQKLDKVINMLDDFESEVDILCLSETWATSVKLTMIYTIYQVFRVSRSIGIKEKEKV